MKLSRKMQEALDQARRGEGAPVSRKMQEALGRVPDDQRGDLSAVDLAAFDRAEDSPVTDCEMGQQKGPVSPE